MSLALLLAATLLPGNTLADTVEPIATTTTEPQVAVQAPPLKWKTRSGAPDNEHSAPVIVNGIIYHSTSSGSLYALDTQTGQTRWEYKPRFEQYGARNVTSVAVTQNLVVYGASNLVKLGRFPEHDTIAAYVIAVDADTGEEKWRFKPVEEAVTAPTVTNNTVYFGSSYTTNRGPTNVYFGQLYALELATGELKWQIPLIDGNIRESLAASDDILYVVVNLAEYRRNAHYLYAIDIPTHRTKWTVSIESDGHDYENRDPILGGNTIYVVGPRYGSGTLYAIDKQSGEIKWQHEQAPASHVTLLDGLPGISASMVFTSPPLLPRPGITTLPALGNDAVYFGTNADTGQQHPAGRAYGNIIEHYLVALESNTGQERWRLRSENELRSRPLFAHNTLYIRGLGSDLVAVDPNTGQVRWKYEAEAPILGQLAADKDTLYFADEAGYFYALTTTLPGMPTTGHQPEQHLIWVTILALLSLTTGLTLTKRSKASGGTED